MSTTACKLWSLFIATAWWRLETSWSSMLKILELERNDRYGGAYP